MNVRRLDLSQSGGLWIPLAGFGVILYVLWMLGDSIAAGSLRMALLIGAAFVAFFVCGKIAHDWRSGVQLCITWLIFEDLIRKYMGNSMVVYFAKDLLVGITYLSLLADGKRQVPFTFRASFRYAVGLFFILGLVQVFNPLSPSIFYGLLGLKLYFYYVPLMFVGYAMLRVESDLRRFMILSMVLASAVSVVGILQTIFGLSFMNPYGGADIDELGHLTRYTPSGLAVIRPPSVFVSDGRFAEYMILACIMGLGTAGYILLRRGGGRWIVFPAVGLVVLASTLGGGRGAFVFMATSTIVLSTGMVWGAPARAGEAYRLVKAIRRSFIFVAIAGILAVSIFPDVIGAHLAFYRETVLPTSEYSETGSRVWDYPVSQIKAAFADPNWLTGHGIGTASLGVQYVSRIMGVPPTNIAVENGVGTLILEFGILGPIIWVIWAGALVIEAWRVVFKLKGTWAFPLGLAIAWLALLLLFPITWGTMTQYQNFVVNAYFWLLVGILFRLPSLVRESLEDSQVISAYAR